MARIITTQELKDFIEELENDKGMGECSLAHPNVVTESTVMKLEFIERDFPELHGTFCQLKHFFDMD